MGNLQFVEDGRATDYNEEVVSDADVLFFSSGISDIMEEELSLGLEGIIQRRIATDRPLVIVTQARASDLFASHSTHKISSGQKERWIFAPTGNSLLPNTAIFIEYSESREEFYKEGLQALADRLPDVEGFALTSGSMILFENDTVRHIGQYPSFRYCDGKFEWINYKSEQRKGNGRNDHYNGKPPKKIETPMLFIDADITESIHSVIHQILGPGGSIVHLPLAAYEIDRYDQFGGMQMEFARKYNVQWIETGEVTEHHRQLLTRHTGERKALLLGHGIRPILQEELFARESKMGEIIREGIITGEYDLVIAQSASAIELGTVTSNYYLPRIARREGSTRGHAAFVPNTHGIFNYCFIPHAEDPRFNAEDSLNQLLNRRPDVEGIATTKYGGLLIVGDQRWKVGRSPLYVTHNGRIMEWEECHSSQEVWY